MSKTNIRFELKAEVDRAAAEMRARCQDPATGDAERKALVRAWQEASIRMHEEELRSVGW